MANPNRIYYQDTGLPHGIQVKIHKGAGTVNGGDFLLLGITNAATSTSAVTFGAQTHLANWTIPASTAINLPFPIECTGFITAETNVNVIYVERGDASAA